ncbi:Arginine N-succinyltransferase [Klebsiella michiganensis]|uniref:Arginine N-succinyltransferase n=1 Tax=Klebsiella michiganensis TaxID=1134687 RepID=A0A7H4N102_9ENTR|nr:Arginine N-succinyltransferase [Klebsiella michiganensis]
MTGCGPFAKSRLVTVVEGQPAPGEWPACLVANEQYQQFRAMLVHADPESDRLVLSARELDALKCHPRRPDSPGSSVP